MSAAEKKFPGRRVIFSALTALAGLLLLTCDFTSFSFNPGDLFALANALFFSLYLAALRIYSGKTDPVQFTFMQHVSSTVVFLGIALAFEMGKVYYGGVDIQALAVLVLSIAISVSTILIQSSAIKHVRPEKATVIYTLEPVAAAMLAYFLIGERLDGIKPFVGCVLILFAIVITIYRKHDAIESTGLKSTFEMKLTKTF
jgi:drug/metabolite transporter (DMT)-like permease